MTHQTVDDLLEAEGFNQTCFDCEHYEVWKEGYPYGEGITYTDMETCHCNNDYQCPRLTCQPDQDRRRNIEENRTFFAIFWILCAFCVGVIIWVAL